MYCLLGDGELSEGSVWEAMAFASFYQLNNLVAILDINRLGQSDPAPLQHQVEMYRKRCEAFGWVHVCVVMHAGVQCAFPPHFPIQITVIEDALYMWLIIKE